MKSQKVFLWYSWYYCGIYEKEQLFLQKIIMKKNLPQIFHIFILVLFL